VIGQIYPMCKDQHGCRFLQKKLDEMNTQTVDIIFNEVYPHFAELMTGKCAHAVWHTSSSSVW
jgi:hypothetical protein